MRTSKRILKTLLIIVIMMVAVKATAQDYKFFPVKYLQSKKDSTVVQDTIKSDTLKSDYNFPCFAMTDTGSTYTDSILVEVYNPESAVWSPVRVRELWSGTESQYAVAGAGQTKTFYIIHPAPYYVRYILVNVQYVPARRTKIATEGYRF